MKSILLLSFSTFLILVGCNSEHQLSIKEISSPVSEKSQLPRLFTDNSGTVFMSWVEETGNLTHLKYASYSDNSWSQTETITSDSTWFVNWADYPSLIARNNTPLASHWLKKVEGGTYAYHVNLSVYDSNWSTSFLPHKDESPTEHGFVSMAPASDSTFMAIWLDGRHTYHRADDEYSDISKAMTLRAALVNQDAEIMDSFLLDDSVCDCCNTSITKTDKGMLAVYRDRTDDEIRDIYITSYTNGKWSTPKPVHADNWLIGACPVNGPAIDSFEDTAAVAWFTGAGGSPQVKLAISADHGQTFSSPILLEKDTPLGRVDLNMNKDKIWVSWLTTNETDAQITIKSFSHDGTELSSAIIKGISKSRSSGFPHISELNEGLLVAYTDVSGEYPRIRTLIVE